MYFHTGILHGYKVPAVMSTYHVPSTYNIDIRDCADGGLDFTSPRSDVFVLNSQIQNNYGTGVNILGMSSNIYNNNNIRPNRFNSTRGPRTRSVQKSSVTSAKRCPILVGNGLCMGSYPPPAHGSGLCFVTS